MADYYPLIARAVATAKDASPDVRAQVYERARGALMKHLRSATPALSADAIEREDVALDEAIARVEAEILSGDAPGQDPDPAPNRYESVPETDAVTPREAPRRPPAPIALPEDPNLAQARHQRWRLLATGGAVAAIAVGVALFALSQREDPGRYAPAVAAEAPANDSGPKLGSRVGGEPVEPARRADSPTNPTASNNSPPVATQPAVAVAQRAIFYEQRPDTPNEPTVVNGRAVWRLESAPSDQQGGQDTIVKVELEFPERAMTVEMVIRRNSDVALPASHLVEIKFQFRAGGGPIKELASPPTMKSEENQRGSPLIGLQVPVMENYFLVGLSNAPADIERNVSQLQSANWIDIPFRFSDDRIGVIAVEKGVQGAEAIEAALARWRG